MTALETLKHRLGIDGDGQNERLSAMLDEAADTILDLIGRESLPTRLKSVQTEIAVILYNRQGAEGESSRSEGGISRSFLDGLPAELKDRLKNYPRKVGVIHSADHGE